MGSPMGESLRASVARSDGRDGYGGQMGETMPVELSRTSRLVHLLLRLGAC